jgi:hypothetical protein
MDSISEYYWNPRLRSKFMNLSWSNLFINSLSSAIDEWITRIQEKKVRGANWPKCAFFVDDSEKVNLSVTDTKPGQLHRISEPQFVTMATLIQSWQRKVTYNGRKSSSMKARKSQESNHCCLKRIKCKLKQLSWQWDEVWWILCSPSRFGFPVSPPSLAVQCTIPSVFTQIKLKQCLLRIVNFSSFNFVDKYR